MPKKASTVARVVRFFSPLASWHWGVLTTVAVGGIAVSAAAFALDRGVERRAIGVDLDRRVRERVERLQEKVVASTQVLHSIAALFETRKQVTRTEFEQFVCG